MDNNSTVRTELRWDINPVDFLEAGTLPVDTKLGHWVLHEGRAVLRLATAENPLTDLTAAAARMELEAMLLIRSVAIDQYFTLSHGPAITQQSPSGEYLIVPLEGGVIQMKGGAIDVMIKEDASAAIRDDLKITEMETGAVLIDTAAQRSSVQKAHMEAGLPQMIKSEALLYMHKSYCQSLADPGNALVHLGEIKDALSKTLGSAKAAEAAMPSAAWNTLGKIANALPVNESRHRGAHFENLRPATQAELHRARAAAKQLIEAFKKLV